MKVLLGIIVFIVVCFAGYGAYLIFYAPASTASFSCASLTTKPVIVAFGDSLVAGYGAPDQQGFVGPLSTQIGTTIINKGEDGDTTEQALNRMPDVLAQHPDIVIVLLGGNDALQQIPLATTKANLQNILTQLIQNHIQVVLVGVLGGFPSDPFAPMFQQLASEYPVQYVPDILSGLITNSKYMSDQVHPNVAGYDIAETKIYPALNKACQQFASLN